MYIRKVGEIMTLEELKKENQRLKEENDYYKKIAYYDAMLGCYNRTWFYDNIFNSTECYLTIADVNCLRTINFVLGHAEGDKLIRECVSIFKKYGDVVRQGGDEFVIVSYDKEKYDELNNTVSNKYSLGGCFKPSTMLVAEAIRDADKKLFENKKYNKSRGIFD